MGLYGAEQNTRQGQLDNITRTLTAGLNGKLCIGYQTLDVTNAVLRLTVPSGATSADITIDVATGSTNPSAAVRYTVDGTTPVTGTASSITHGSPVGDFDTIEITGNTNLNAFQVIAVDVVAHKFLRINYYR